MFACSIKFEAIYMQKKTNIFQFNSIDLIYFLKNLKLKKRASKVFLSSRVSSFFFFFRIMLITREKSLMQRAVSQFYAYLIGDRCRAAIAMQHNSNHRQLSMAGT